MVIATTGWKYKLKEYAKLMRSFNAGLTGIAPVLGAIAVRIDTLELIIILFLIGVLSHIYGFVLNDYIDVNIDAKSIELRERPLVSGSIQPSQALALATTSLIGSWLLTILFLTPLALLLLLIGDLLATVYNLISKRISGMDVFVAGAIFFLILTGATAKTVAVSDIPLLAYIVAIIGFLQVLYMNAINGGIKDIDHDADANAKTVAVALNVRVVKEDNNNNNRQLLQVPIAFKCYAYGITTTHLAFIFLPFLLFENFYTYSYIYQQTILLVVVAIITVYMVTKLLTLKYFRRDNIRKIIGLHVIFMYALAPIMLVSVNYWAGLLVFFPPLWFITTNVILHGRLLAPKTM